MRPSSALPEDMPKEATDGEDPTVPVGGVGLYAEEWMCPDYKQMLAELRNRGDCYGPKTKNHDTKHV